MLRDARLADRVHHGAQSSGWANSAFGQILSFFYPSVPSSVDYTPEELALDVLVSDIIAAIDQVLEDA